MPDLSKANLLADIVASPEASGMRIDVFLSMQQNLNLTRSRIQSLIQGKYILLNHKPVGKAGKSLMAGDHLLVYLPKPSPLDLVPHEMNLEILYEDEHLAFINKPAGISVHPSATENEKTLVHGLMHALKNRLSSIGGFERPGIVHRLDKGTSGVLVVSKTDGMHLALSKIFKEHSIQREYQALVFGSLAVTQRAKSGTIQTKIGRHPTDRKKMSTKVKDGRVAITHWKILKEWCEGKLSLVACALETGRTHQIRVHLSEKGHSIVGDPAYGDHSGRIQQFKKKFPQVFSVLEPLRHQLLHAGILGFEHPLTKKRLLIEAPLPKDFKEVLSVLENES